MTKNRVIAKDGKLPWDISEEFNLFLNSIKGTVAIMGRITYEAIKHADITIVVSNKLDKANAIICKTFREALEKAKTYNKPISILGGTDIYSKRLIFEQINRFGTLRITNSGVFRENPDIY